MNILELDEIEASLLNPDDPAQVDIVVDAAGVGKTNRLSTGQIITWTAANLRQFAPSMKGMPINVQLRDGELGGHSRNAVGAITEATFDEGSQVVRATGVLWPHYYPALIAKLKELFPSGKVQTSMEFTPSGELQSNADGSQTPTSGRFSGLGLVRKGADPRSRALLLASAEEDISNQQYEVSMNLDQITEAVARRMGHREPDPDFVASIEAAGPDDADPTPDETESPTPTDGATDMEAPIVDPTNEELRSTLRAELQTEFQAQIAVLTAERDAAIAVNTQREEAARLDTLATSRATELDTIHPVTTDAGRARRLATVRTLSDEAFEALKAELADVAEVKGGLHSDADPNVDSDEGKTPMQIAVEKELAEIRAARSADPSKEK